MGFVMHVSCVSGQNGELECNVRSRKSASQRQRVPRAPAADIGALRRDRHLTRQPLADTPLCARHSGNRRWYQLTDTVPASLPKVDAGFRSQRTLQL